MEPSLNCIDLVYAPCIRAQVIEANSYCAAESPKDIKSIFYLLKPYSGIYTEEVVLDLNIW